MDRLIDENGMKIAEHNGLDAQFLQLIEEMSELTQVICKHFRMQGKGQAVDPNLTEEEVYYNLVEEIADVKFVLNQVIYLLGINPNKDVLPKLIAEIDEITCKKELRTMERIGIQNE